MVPDQGFIHISSEIMVVFSYLGINIPLSHCSCRIKPGNMMSLYLGITLLDSTTEIHLVLSSQCIVGAPVARSRDSVQLRPDLVLFKALHKHRISLSLELE